MKSFADVCRTTGTGLVLSICCAVSSGCGGAEGGYGESDISEVEQATLYCSNGHYGWARADQPTSPSYTPSSSFSKNESGGPITVTRSAQGAYSITFGGLVASGGNVQVVSFGEDANRCKVASWSNSASGQQVSVRCHAPSGAAADARFVVLFGAMDAGDCATAAYLWSSNATASHQPFAAWSYNSAGGQNFVTRLGTGKYQVRLGNLAAPLGHALVTAYGTTAHHCKPTWWGPSGNDVLVDVRCSDASGAASDSMFSLRYQEDVVGGAIDTGYAWLSNPTATSYAPDARYTFNSRNGDNLAKRSATGRYSVDLPGIRFQNAAGFASSYEDNGNYCKVRAWSGGEETTTLSTDCFTPTGARVNGLYSAFFVSTRLPRTTCDGDICVTRP